MAKSGTFTYALRPRCAPAEAVALLSDFSRHDELHPLIVKVTELPPADGAVRSFRINDRLALGPFRFTTTYHADVLRVTDDEVVTVARQSPGTTLHNHTRLHAAGDGRTWIEVRITLTTPAPLYAYAFKQAWRAHRTLAARLNQVLDQ